MNWVLPKGVKLSSILNDSKYKTYLWDSNTGNLIPCDTKENKTECECGVKFTGGLHSDWCPVSLVEAETQRNGQ